MRKLLSSLRPKAPRDLFGCRPAIGVTAVLLVLLLGSARGWAVSEAEDPPIYNAASKSYFQLLKTTGKHGNWPESLVQAREKIYKGVHGRLAVVNTPEIHEFIMRNFDVSRPIWIGLRYWCEFRLLEWVGLKPFSPSDSDSYQLWHSQWSRDDQDCPPNATGPGAFMGVYYQPLSKTNAVWQAVRTGKGFNFLLVEYPTGGE